MLRLALCSDSEFPVRPDVLARALNQICRSTTFVAVDEPIEIPQSPMSNPHTYESIAFEKIKKSTKTQQALLFTQHPYENNFYFDSPSDDVIISFANWRQLSDLNISNGVFYFVAANLMDYIGVGTSHETLTGCINDFWQYKPDVNIGMRAAFVCSACRSGLQGLMAGSRQIFVDVESILDVVSRASRYGLDVLTLCEPSSSMQRFDLFICHHTEEKRRVRSLDKKLKKLKVRTWFDEEQIKPGDLWQQVIEQAIPNIKAAAVFVGKSGYGPWHEFEIRAFLSEFRRRNCRVIPILMDKPEIVPELPLFLRELNWVDLDDDEDAGLRKIADAVLVD